MFIGNMFKGNKNKGNRFKGNKSKGDKLLSDKFKAQALAAKHQAEQSSTGLYRFTNLYQRALYKRRQLKKQHLLTQRNLFIFPSLLGLYYLIFVLLLWLLGTNYQNNLILALSYLLLSVMLISIFHCYFNMRGLTVIVREAEGVFCGELALITLCFTRDSQNSQQGLTLGWYKSSMQAFVWDGQQTTQTLSLATEQRGELQPPRLVLKSYYPLGLLRCWCLLSLDIQVKVYPKPEIGGHRLSTADKSDDQAINDVNPVGADQDEFQELRLYRPSDSVNNIAWKQYARTGTLYHKNYSGDQRYSLSLNWQDYQATSAEQKLQNICFDALALNRAQRVFSLQLPGVLIKADSGEAHLNQVLSALALFDVTAESSAQVAS